MITNVEDFTYIQEWLDKMKSTIRLKYTKEQISDKKINKYLINIIKERLKDRDVIIVNNYTNKVSHMTILHLIELIRNNRLICAGAGCLFLPHDAKKNILIDFILNTMAKRDQSKALRKKYEKGTDEWNDENRNQMAFKLIINSLYGCLGYPGFTMFNVFIAESITTQGKQIITTAINAVENFLGDNMYFDNSNEIFNVINNILNECHKKIKDKFSEDTLNKFRKRIDLNNLPRLCTDRFLKHCLFVYDNKLENLLLDIFNNLSVEELLMIYYKNNFMEFSRLPFIKDKIKNLIIKNGPLQFCEDYCYKDAECVELLNDIWDFYDLFVNYNYPIYDKVRKAMYIDKDRSLYTDTDSAFVSLNETVMYICHEVFNNYEESNMSEQDLIFTSVNVALSICNRMIKDAMYTLCTSINVSEDYKKLLIMKNEFYFPRIMFTDVKKRYSCLSALQEGQILYSSNGNIGRPEVTGFDFKKAGTKELVRNFCLNLCYEDILYAKEINLVKIFKKVMDFKSWMEEEIGKGNTEFMKQMNVKKIEAYKNPYSYQGVKAVLLWNTIMPNKSLEFPVDINIVPIKDLTYPKQKEIDSNNGPVRSVIKSPLDYKEINKFYEKYPNIYNRINNTIYKSTNPLIRHMGLNYIAIPKTMDYELPDYIYYLIDSKSIVDDAMNLIIPILKPIGINSFKPSTTSEYITNIISI